MAITQTNIMPRLMLGIVTLLLTLSTLFAVADEPESPETEALAYEKMVRVELQHRRISRNGERMVPSFGMGIPLWELSAVLKSEIQINTFRMVWSTDIAQYHRIAYALYDRKNSILVEDIADSSEYYPPTHVRRTYKGVTDNMLQRLKADTDKKMQNPGTLSFMAFEGLENYGCTVTVQPIVQKPKASPNSH